MSSSEQKRLPPKRLVRLSVVALAFAAATLSACTVRPLYGDVSASVAPDQAIGSSVSMGIREVNTRYGQEVRNHLIFGFNGGAGQPDKARFNMSLSVTSRVQSAMTIQRTSNDNEPTAGSVTLTARFTVRDSTTRTLVSSGRRSVVSSYDIPQQSFSALRAERDAEDRAARELAEFIRLAVLADIARLQTQ